MKKNVLDDILYSQCWEDPLLDRAAFSITPSDIVFSITSGGCNVLAFLLDNPRKVISLDINPHQNYLLDLKMGAFRQLGYDELLEFVGVRDSHRRTDLYARVRLALQPASRKYWDTQSSKIEQGIIHCGRYEHYMRLLRYWVHRLMGRSLVEKFFEVESSAERKMLFDSNWDNVWWKLFTRVFLSRIMMSFLFDKAFFRYLDESFPFGKHFAARVKHAMTELPMKENYYLSYILLGKFFSDEHLPPYLQRGNYPVIRARLDRIEIVCDTCEHFFLTQPASSVSKFNFTNIFEWMSPEAFEHLLRETYRVACDDAIVTYRNLLVHRERPGSLAHKIHPKYTEADRLHERDLSFIYKNYRVEQIHKERKSAIPYENRIEPSHVA